jgi:ribosomal protein S18 acetylase RimI-like enzyme
VTNIQYLERPALESTDLNALFAKSWPGHRDRDFERVHARSLTYFCAFAGAQLVGYVNIATDGVAHAFLLDPTVHPSFRHRGIGTELLHRATSAARSAKAEWLHVDFEPALEPFYSAAGFRPSAAGLIALSGSAPPAV